MTPNRWITKLFHPVYVRRHKPVFTCPPVEGGSAVHYDYLNSVSIKEMCPLTEELGCVKSSCRYDEATNNILSILLRTGKVSQCFKPITLL